MVDFEKLANSWEVYDYEKAVFEDVKDALIENMEDYVDENTEDIEEIRDAVNDALWTADNVTGNGSGSYTFNRMTAELYLVGNGDLYEEAIEEFGDKYNAEAENRDVTIRCYLLPSAIEKALEDEDVIAAYNKAKGE